MSRRQDKAKKQERRVGHDEEQQKGRTRSGVEKGAGAEHESRTRPRDLRTGAEYEHLTGIIEKYKLNIKSLRNISSL